MTVQRGDDSTPGQGSFGDYELDVLDVLTEGSRSVVVCGSSLADLSGVYGFSGTPVAGNVSHVGIGL